MEERPVESVEEARLVIRELRDRYRTQAHQLIAWRRRVKQQEELFVRMARERAEQLKTLSAQLILFESRLCRKQKDLANLLAQRDSIIARQQRTIQVLRARLADAGLDCCESPPPGETATNLDSLNDSDSAVIMEEGDGESSSGHGHAHGSSAHAHGHGQGQASGHAWHHGRYAGRSGGAAAVVRSVSDALEQPKYPSLRRSNGFLRRPEILETVYSVEEDGEGEQTSTPSASAAASGGQAADSSSSADNATSGPEDAPDEDGCSGRLQALYGSFERLHESPPTPQSPHHRVMTTYNRVMSNHRSVTKPKDVKYKRINKAKSKSLEELRGRLRNWVDKGNKLAVSLDQSYA